MHYIDILENPFTDAGLDVYPNWCAEVMPYNNICWTLALRDDVEWKDDTVVIVELQDYASVVGGRCNELKQIEKHFGSRSNQVVVVHWETNLREFYDGMLNLAYFPTHSHQLFQDLRDTQNQWQDQLLSTQRTKNFQCLNGIPKPHREKVVNYVKAFDNGIISLSTDIQLPEWNYTTYKECDNVTNWQRLLPVYSSCHVNIVTETLYYRPGIITEKTLFAFMALQIPIVIGHKGIVQQCRDLGFDMFDDIVDNSYDDLPDFIRWREALKKNKKLLVESVNRTEIMDRLLKNQEYLLNGFLDKLVNDFTDSARDIIQYRYRKEQ
jgi:hypothetical protein